MKSFVYAFRGISHTLKKERNMRVHLCFAFYVICGGLVVKLSVTEWAVVLICIGIVTALECLNTALETLCDEVRPEKNNAVKITKDVSAGAVLCASAASAFAGGIIFFCGEKPALAITFFKEQPLLSAAIFLTLIPASIFVFRRKK